MKTTILALALLAGSVSARAQFIAAPPYPLAADNTAAYIEVASIVESGISTGLIPWNATTAYDEGYLFGLVESNAQFFDSPDFDAPQDVPYYDSTPYTIDSEAVYATLRDGYLAEGSSVLNGTQGRYGQPFLFDAGFFAAMHDALVAHFGLDTDSP